MKVIIGTKNQKKIDVAASIFMITLAIDTIEVIGHDAKSGVPEAPHAEETFRGALNRARGCFALGGADYFVGVESGLVERYGNMFEEAWAVILSADGRTYVGYSSGLMLPALVTKRMQDGEKHNEIMFSIDKQFNLPDDNRDTWSRYTGGTMSRQLSLEEAIRNALIQTVPTDRNLYTF